MPLVDFGQSVQRREWRIKLKKNVTGLANAGMVLTALIWGFAFVVVKDSVDFIPPVYMLAFRFTIAFAGLALVFCKKLFKISKRDLFCGGILGILLFISYFFQTVAIQYTTAGKNAFLTTIYVVIVPFLHWFINKKKPDGYCIAAAFLAIAGIGLLSLQGDLSMNIGDILTIICGFGFAFHMIYIDRYTEKHDPVALTILQIGVAALISWLMAPLYDGTFPEAAFSMKIVTSMLYLGLGSTMIAFLLQNVCQKYTTPSSASLFLSLESVFGVLCSLIFLKEYLTVRMAIGCALIFAAILLAETKLSFLKGNRKDKEMEIQEE
ncbi:DMT family transporter [Qiania dongpingensis]|uniref:DMT family transporter n=1 Tax=Qiania dongpingensis TaxID=2763669 RepID=A0A7G9G3S0_9FIRM|nr:DMT family transporter [Qiania dongpingensis]